jgi:hypothetical protein
MSVVAFFSAKGSPGTTTAAMLVSSLWPRPALLVDCDPAGGDVGLRLAGPDGRELDPDRGLLSLLPVARRSLRPDVLLEHAQSVVGGGQVILGLAGPEQANVAGPLWSTLAQAFSSLEGYDVIIDAGRLDSMSAHLPIVKQATVAVAVLRADVSGVVIARSRLRGLRPALTAGGSAGPLVGLVVRSGPNARDVDGAVDTIRGESSDVDFFGELANDDDGAGIFSGRPVNRPERTLLVRSGAAIVSQLASAVHPEGLPDSGWQQATMHGDEPESSPRGRRRANRAKASSKLAEQGIR